jgi:hypothetical protein
MGQVNRCFRCDQLLCDLGQALLRFHEVENMLWEPQLTDDANLSDDYRRAKAECARLRIQLMMHLDLHDSLEDSGKSNFRRPVKRAFDPAMTGPFPVPKMGFGQALSKSRGG